MCSFQTCEHTDVTGHGMAFCNTRQPDLKGKVCYVFPAPSRGFWQQRQEGCGVQWRRRGIQRFTNSLTPFSAKILKTHPSTILLRHEVNLEQENLSLYVFSCPARKVTEVSVLTSSAFKMLLVENSSLPSQKS